MPSTGGRTLQLNTWLIQFLRNLRGSYWFVPGTMVIVAIALSAAMLEIDSRLELSWAQKTSWIFAARSDGARSVLSTIAGSMIGIAGVTFSMTLVSVSFAAANYGPRVIGNFMRDRGNQVTLGTFIATFVYAILVLRRVRGGSDDLSALVPHLSLLVALFLTLLSVAVLVYFIHHVPETINVSRLIAGIGRSLTEGMVKVFPAEVGSGSSAERGSSEGRTDQEEHPTLELCSKSIGYLQVLNEDRLFELAREHDLVLVLQFRPGDFAIEGDGLLRVHPGNVSKEAIKELLACFAFGSERTAAQDPLFQADQLVEILGRALSPGVNDPYTAISCLQWLQSALCVAATHEPPSARRYDAQGRLRLVARPLTFERLVKSVVSSSLQYVASDRNVAVRFAGMLGAVAVRAPTEDRRALVLEQLAHLQRSAEEHLPLQLHRDEIAKRCTEIRRMVDDPAARRALLDDGRSWIGGSA